MLAITIKDSGKSKCFVFQTHFVHYSMLAPYENSTPAMPFQYHAYQINADNVLANRQRMQNPKITKPTVQFFLSLLRFFNKNRVHINLRKLYCCFQVYTHFYKYKHSCLQCCCKLQFDYHNVVGCTRLYLTMILKRFSGILRL